MHSEPFWSALGAALSGLSAWGMLKSAVHVASWLARRAARAALVQSDGEPLGRSARWTEEGRLANPRDSYPN